MSVGNSNITVYQLLAVLFFV